MAEPDIGVTFGGQLKEWLGKIFSPGGVQWLLVAGLLYHALIWTEQQQADWRKTLLHLAKDQQTVIVGHVKQVEHEAKQAEISRRTIAEYMLIACYNAATDVVQRKRCIERDVPTDDTGSYGRELPRGGRR